MAEIISAYGVKANVFVNRRFVKVKLWEDLQYLHLVAHGFRYAIAVYWGKHFLEDVIFNLSRDVSKNLHDFRLAFVERLANLEHRNTVKKIAVYKSAFISQALLHQGIAFITHNLAHQRDTDRSKRAARIDDCIEV